MAIAFKDHAAGVAAQPAKKRNALVVAFVATLNPLRAAYQEQVQATLEELRPRIERGEFTDLGDRYTIAERGSAGIRFVAPRYQSTQGCLPGQVEIDPGINLLEWALRKLLVCKESQFARAALTASTVVVDADYGGDELLEALHCFARDVRAAYRRSLKQKAVSA